MKPEAYAGVLAYGAGKPEWNMLNVTFFSDTVCTCAITSGDLYSGGGD